MSTGISWVHTEPHRLKMSEIRIIVDHLKLDYKGIFDTYELFRQFDAWLHQRGYEKEEHKNTEQTTPTGKQIEWELTHWKKISFHAKYRMKIRVLIWDLKKVDAVRDNQKIKISHGRMLIYFDAYLELDYEHYWEKPILTFIRTMYDKFIFKSYTEGFEQKLTSEVTHLYHHIMNFLNMYNEYKVISKIPNFAIH